LPKKNKTIVFSQFTSMLDIIEPFLQKEGIAFARYDGSMKNDDREASLRRLRGEGEFAPRKGKEDRNWCGVLLCSLKCGALGLNLVTACRVVILEPFWNPVCLHFKPCYIFETDNEVSSSKSRPLIVSTVSVRRRTSLFTR
jgi:SNF2 family DNA or RNA helicase